MSTMPEQQVVPGLVSVVTATYNMGRYIAQTLESVLGQDYPQVESIVVDDGSTDDTAAVLARFAGDPRLRVVRQANAGQTVAKNRGIAEARGEFIAFCDADDTWEPHKLSRQIPRFRADDRVAVVFSEIDNIDDQGRPLAGPRLSRFEGRVTAQLLIDNFIPFPSVVVRADALRAAGGFDESLTMSIDYDLWLRISTRFRFACVPEVLAHYRLWPGQMSHKTGERLDNFERLFERFLAAHPGVVTRREIDRARAHFLVTRGYWHAAEGRRHEARRDYRRAFLRDPLDRRLWLCVAAHVTGRDRRRREAAL
jgi:glycosyltransferase involved in cell wall biosynthesis